MDGFSREDVLEAVPGVHLSPRNLLFLVIAGGLLISLFLFLEISRLERAGAFRGQSSQTRVGHQGAVSALLLGLAVTGAAAGWLIAERRRFFRAQILIEKLSREARDRREDEQRLRLLAEAAPDTVLLLDPEGLVMDLNPAAETSLSRVQREVRAKPFCELAHPDERARVRGFFESVRASQKPAVTEFRVSGGAEDPEFMQFSLTPEVEGNRVRRLLALGRDVTGRHKAEVAKAALEAQLREAQQMEALGRLAGAVAHDFNNILTTILSNCQVARMELVHGHPAVRSLDELNEAGQRAAALVRQILNFARSQGSERQVVILESIVRDALKLLQPILPSAVRIELRAAPDCPAVKVNIEQVHQVLMNLGTNAAHAMKAREGKLDISLEKVAVDKDLAARHSDLRPGVYLRLSVGNTGHGMDADTLARVFEPAFATKPPGQGTGLGLSIVQSIIRNHDGAITVSSQPNEGTVFNLYFPAVSEEPTLVEGESLESVEGKGRHILLVGNTPALADGETDLLQHLGYRISKCSSSSDALERFLLAPDQYDCIVGDVVMSGLNGFEFAAECQMCKPGIPFLLLSLHSIGLSGDSLRALGISAVLVKPFPVRVFIRALQRALNAKNA